MSNITLDPLKVEYFNEHLKDKAGIPLEKIIDNLFRSYIVQTSVQGPMSYAEWLEEKLRVQEGDLK